MRGSQGIWDCPCMLLHALPRAACPPAPTAPSRIPPTRFPPLAQPPHDCHDLLAQKRSSHHCALAGKGSSTPKHLQRWAGATLEGALPHRERQSWLWHEGFVVGAQARLRPPEAGMMLDACGRPQAH